MYNVVGCIGAAMKNIGKKESSKFVMKPDMITIFKCARARDLAELLDKLYNTQARLRSCIC